MFNETWLQFEVNCSKYHISCNPIQIFRDVDLHPYCITQNPFMYKQDLYEFVV